MTTAELDRLSELEALATTGEWHVEEGSHCGFPGSFDVQVDQSDVADLAALSHAISAAGGRDQ